MKMAQEMLELVDIHVYYGECQVLQGVSLKVEPGSVVALLGRNGMGKTTTIRSIIGFNTPRSGEIRFKGKNIIGLASYKIAQMGMGLVPQGRHIFPSLSVKENLTTVARNTEKVGNWSLDKVYALFPPLEERANLGSALLSGGEQQMLIIARALMTNPDLVLMDEPSEGLAPIIVREITHIIGQLKQSGLSILLVEQNVPMALAVADYAYIIDRGATIYRFTAEELEKNEKVKDTYLGISK